MNISQANISTPAANGLQAPTVTMPELVLQRIRLRARRRIIWLRTLWQQAKTNGGGAHDFHTEVDGYLNNFDAPETEMVWQSSDAGTKVINLKINEVEQFLKKQKGSRLRLLEKKFGLTPNESDLLQTCFALSIEPNLSRVYAYLQDHVSRGYVTETLVARLFGHGRSLSLKAGSPLTTWSLVLEKEGSKGEPTLFEIDPHIRNWLLGQNDISHALINIAHIQPTLKPLRDWPVKEVVHFIKNTTVYASGQRQRICIAGQPGSGRSTFAACVSKQLRMPLLTLDCKHLTEPQQHEVARQAQRLAILNNWALAWRNGSRYIEENPQQTLPAMTPHFVICESDYFISPSDGIVDYRIELPTPTLEERRLLWKRLVPESATWVKTDFENMIYRYQSSVGQIAAVRKKGIQQAGQASLALRSSTRHLLGNLAQWMECPFDWDDLVASDWLKSILDDFLFEATDRAAFWEQPNAQRLFPQGRGLLGLFTGPPGTGKTMAAQVVAAKIGLDLFRIDMSTVVSKYVGETSKNLERILSRAHRMNAVLLFDEADALFGKRTEVKDAHDRYANTDTNYLLQAIESYPGIAILASNKKGNIDSGFIRRLRYVLEFPKPDAAQRLLIWQKVVGGLAGQDTLKEVNGKLPQLAETIDLTGAQIKYSTLSAVFIARQKREGLSIKHLLRGIERELMKEGRGLSRQVHERLNY